MTCSKNLLFIDVLGPPNWNQENASLDASLPASYLDSAEGDENVTKRSAGDDPVSGHPTFDDSFARACHQIAVCPQSVEQRLLLSLLLRLS